MNKENRKSSICMERGVQNMQRCGKSSVLGNDCNTKDLLSCVNMHCMELGCMVA